MICKRCGAENNETARFCRNCGNEFKQESIMTVSLDSNNQKYKKRTRKKRGVFLILILVIAGVIASFWITKSKKEKKIKEYKNQITQGNKYVEDLDYEKAEESYLKAIKVDPKRKDPYLKLADVYVAQEKYDKAVKILEDAYKNVTVTEINEKKKQNISDIKKKIEEKKEEISNSMKYTWEVKPEIDAKNIYYVMDMDIFKPQNRMNIQYKSPYAVIENEEGKKGLIDMEGNIKIAEKYDTIYHLSGYYWLNAYVMKNEDSEEIYNYECDKEVKNIDKDEWKSIQEEMKKTNIEYWHDGLKSTNTKQIAIPTTAIPVKKSETILNENEINQIKGKYAITKGKKLVTNFKYDKCGTSSDELLAVKKNGKWGYVNENGKNIIPIEYDASWEYNVSKEEKAINPEITDDKCYGGSGGYIVLKKGKEWKIVDTYGKTVILPGVFDEIRPVFDGKCWVKKNGKWGVIKFKNENYQTNKYAFYRKMYEPIIDKYDKALTTPSPFEDIMYKNVCEYVLWDIDKNGIEELIIKYPNSGVSYGMLEAYTIKNSKVISLGKTDDINLGGLYVEELDQKYLESGYREGIDNEIYEEWKYSYHIRDDEFIVEGVSTDISGKDLFDYSEYKLGDEYAVTTGRLYETTMLFN